MQNIADIPTEWATSYQQELWLQTPVRPSSSSSSLVPLTSFLVPRPKAWLWEAPSPSQYCHSPELTPTLEPSPICQNKLEGILENLLALPLWMKSMIWTAPRTRSLTLWQVRDLSLTSYVGYIVRTFNYKSQLMIIASRNISPKMMTWLGDHQELNTTRSHNRFLHYNLCSLIIYIQCLALGGCVSNLNYCQTKNKIFMNIFTILGVGFCPHVI